MTLFLLLLSHLLQLLLYLLDMGKFLEPLVRSQFINLLLHVFPFLFEIESLCFKLHYFSRLVMYRPLCEFIDELTGQLEVECGTEGLEQGFEIHRA